MSIAGRLRRAVLGIAPEEAGFPRRGFRLSNPAAQARLERAGRTFIEGYNRALAEPRVVPLAEQLNGQVEEELRGFAYEGAAMALALVDWLYLPRLGRPLARWSRFAAGPGAAHIYMVHVGAGWAAARLPWIRRNVERQLRRFDPLLGWLMLDGYGFHQGYFDPERFLAARARPHRLSAAGQAVFDQGLGRSMWFVCGADVALIAARIAAFPASRRGDLWSGVGLACAYAGGVDRDSIERLAADCGEHRPAVAQGAAFGAEARRRAGNLSAHTEMACEVLCATSAVEAADVTDACRETLAADGNLTAYEVWRRRIQSRFQLSLAKLPFEPAVQSGLPVGRLASAARGGLGSAAENLVS